MDDFYIIANSSKREAIEAAIHCQNILNNLGKKSYIHNEYTLKNNPNYYIYLDANDIPDNAECVIVIGGDGTMIKAARDLINKELPLLGVNLGTMGYLMDTELENLSFALKKICEDDYELEKRMLLEGEIFSNGESVYKDIVLNDIVITRKDFLKLNDVDVYINDFFLYRYASDGIILATPTGSTGYSMSAGGPIVSPDSDMILLTPICPHDICSKSIALNSKEEIIIKIPQNRRGYNQKLKVYFDCDNLFTIETGDYVLIKKSKKYVNLIKLQKTSFMETLKSKMN